MRGNLLKYVVHLHEPPFLIGILGVAIGAPEVATGQSHENTGSAGIGGLPLNAVKNLIHLDRHDLFLPIEGTGSGGFGNLNF